MIKKFRHKGLKRFFDDPRYTDKRGISAGIADRLIVISDALNTIEDAVEMDIAGLYFHGLKGQRRGEYSVRVFRKLAYHLAYEWQRCCRY